MAGVLEALRRGLVRGRAAPLLQLADTGAWSAARALSTDASPGASSREQQNEHPLSKLMHKGPDANRSRGHGGRPQRQQRQQQQQRRPQQQQQNNNNNRARRFDDKVEEFPPLESPSAQELEEIAKLEAQIKEEDMRNLDLRGFNLVARVSGVEKGQTTYDLGLGPTLTVPRPLHTGKIAHGVSSAGKLESAAKAEVEEPGTTGKGIKEDVVLRVEESDLMLNRGELLPDFNVAPMTKQEEEVQLDPADLSWRMLEYAVKARKPVRARMLNKVNGGFAVGIGAVVGFLPNSHFSPFLKGPQSKLWEPLVAECVGSQLWVMLLAVEPAMANVVVSHRTVPRTYLHPSIAKMPHRYQPRQFSGARNPMSRREDQPPTSSPTFKPPTSGVR